MEKDIWSSTAKVLTSEQRGELRQLILLWRKNNPDKVVYNYLRFSDFAAQRRNSTLVKKVQAGGLFKTVKQVMAGINNWSVVTLDNVMAKVAIEREAFISQFMNRLIGEQKIALEAILTEEKRVTGLVTELRKAIEGVIICC